MNVYVESNFVLELALLQEQSNSCEDILSLAESGGIRLVVPAYSLIEPFETLIRREKDRRGTGQELNNQIKQILRAAEEDKKRLKSVRSRLLQSACVIPMDASVLRDAEKHEQELKLSPQDAHIYSAVLGNLRQPEDRVSCFLNKDRKDFDEPDIVDELKSYGCKLIPSFDRGNEYILSEIG